MSEETAVIRAEPPAAIVRVSGVDFERLCRALVQCGYFREIRDASQAMVKAAYGAELGIGPVTAMTSIHIVEGRPCLSANLIGALVKRSARYDYRIAEWSDEACTIEWYEHGKPVGRSSWNAEDTRRAGLSNKDNWRRYGKAMCFSRALTQGARAYCPDVAGGMAIYAPEELGATVDEEGLPLSETVTPPAPAPEAQLRPAQEPGAYGDDVACLREHLAALCRERMGDQTATSGQMKAWLAETVGFDASVPIRDLGAEDLERLIDRVAGATSYGEVRK